MKRHQVCQHCYSYLSAPSFLIPFYDFKSLLQRRDIMPHNGKAEAQRRVCTSTLAHQPLAQTKSPMLLSAEGAVASSEG
jgi:hypothetical protein